MTFNNGTDSIVSDINFLVNTDDTIYPLTDKARNANKYYAKAFTLVRFANTRYRLKDTENTFDSSTFNLVAGTGTYSSSGVLPDVVNENSIVTRVESFIDATGNDSRVLINITESEIPIAKTDFFEQNGVPIYYEIIGTTITLYPAPDYTVAAGLRVYFTDGVKPFLGDNSASDNARIPSIPYDFHEYISKGAAYEYAIANDITKAETLKRDMTVMEKEMQKYSLARSNTLKQSRLSMNTRTIR